MLRTHTCGELRTAHVGQQVTLAGWVQRRRDHGGLIFVDLRDRYGLTQTVFNPGVSAAAHNIAVGVRQEYVLAVRGVVRRRPEPNPDLATGDVEVVASGVELLNPAKTPPFAVTENGEVDEAMRLRYRYLDLRRARMQRNIILRHEVVKFIRDYLSERGFLEIETPILIKSTPEGARDYVVPSRVHPGRFYALPQSPQQLKQLLMVSGFDRYFQIARCFRDEDPRADRQQEFTQLDLEMAFVEQEDIVNLIERLFTDLVRKVAPEWRVMTPFARMSYDEAMDRYGTDKPDVRFGMELIDLSALLEQSGFRVFRDALASGGRVKAIVAPGCAGYSRAQTDELGELAVKLGAKGLAHLAVAAEGLRGPQVKLLAEGELAGVTALTGAKPGDLILVVADQPTTVAKVLGGLRRELGARLGLAAPDLLAFAWVVDFPLVEWNASENRWDAVHHPFTMPKRRDWDLLDSDPARVRADCYDIVLNGVELGSGSIRIHRRDIQEKVFQLLNYSPDEAMARFGHMLEAFEFGAPPHGGMAPGIDRLVMLLAREDNIREVMAFPKTKVGTDPMTGAPSELDETQLKELHLRIVE